MLQSTPEPRRLPPTHQQGAEEWITPVVSASKTLPERTPGKDVGLTVVREPDGRGAARNRSFVDGGSGSHQDV